MPTKTYLIQLDGGAQPGFEVQAQDEFEARHSAIDEITAKDLKVENLRIIDKATGYYVL